MGETKVLAAVVTSPGMVADATLMDVQTTQEVGWLNGFVAAIMEKTEFSRERFVAEVRRAMSGRRVQA